jgi:drug/metabolite transporter (DMT)-like permease
MRQLKQAKTAEDALPSTLMAALFTVTLWASAFVGIRSAGKALSPGALSLGRLLVGALVLGIILVVRGERLPRWSQLRSVAWPLLVTGVLWFGGYNLALNAAERRVDAGTAAMLVNVGPILVALLAGVVLKEGFPRALIGGIAIAFAGVAIIGLATTRHAGASADGLVLCLAAAFAYAGGVVAQKPVLRRLPALQTTFLCCAIGAVVCLPFGPALAQDVRAASPGPIVWMVYLGIFPTALAFTTWAYALARTNAGRLAAMTYLVPPISVLLGWLFLSETPPLLALAGGAFCLMGVGVSRRRPMPVAGGQSPRRADRMDGDASAPRRTLRTAAGTADR